MMCRLAGIVISIAFLLLALRLVGQDEEIYPDTLHKHRFIGVTVTGGALYAASLAGLYNLWYKDYPQSSFHWFNDSGEWLYMDKAGHTTASYWLARIGYNATRWSGVKENTAIWTGGMLGMVYLTTVEVFDGFSAGWGASPGDLMANTLGSALFIGQQAVWHKQPLSLKFSYWPTDYPQYRPDLLGENGLQSMLKDYNGQTYWLSGNIHSFLQPESKFPRWLNVALGYGADGMLGANSNPPEYNGEPLPDFDRVSQYYLTLDVDLTKIRTRSQTVKLILNTIGFIKIPFPAVEYNKSDKFVWHWVMF